MGFSGRTFHAFNFMVFFVNESGPGSTSQAKLEVDPFTHSVSCFVPVPPRLIYTRRTPNPPKSYHHPVCLGLGRAPLLLWCPISLL